MGAEFVLKIDVVDQEVNTEVVEHRTLNTRVLQTIKEF